MKHFLMCLLYIAALGVLSFVVGRLIPKHWFHADRFPWVCHHDRRNLRGRVDTYSVVYRRSWTAENMVRCWRGMYNDYLHCAG